MADAQKINPNETLRTSYPKINQAIENSNQAKKDSEEALQTANEAKFKADSTKTELDQIVIEGDSSVEAAQARVDADGNPHTTLKERLDFEHNELSSQLAQKASNSRVDNLIINALEVSPQYFSSILDFRSTEGAIRSIGATTDYENTFNGFPTVKLTADTTNADFRMDLGKEYDFTESKYIGLFLKTENLDDIYALQITFATEPEFLNEISRYQLKDIIGEPDATGWILVKIPRETIKSPKGEPDWTKMRAVKIVLVANEGVTTSVNVASLLVWNPVAVNPEILDSRKGVDGTTYDLLGQRLDAELKNRFLDIRTLPVDREKYDGIRESFYSFTTVEGAIRATNAETDVDVTFMGNPTVKLTSESGDLSDFRVDFGDITDLSNENYLGFYVKINNINHLSHIQVELGESNLDCFIIYDATPYISAASEDGWYFIRLNKEHLKVTRGEPDWTKIKYLRFVVVGKSDVTATLNIANIVKGKNKVGAVFMFFDDGVESQYTKAFPIMEKYGLKGTIAVITSRVGTPGYVTWSQLREMHQAGWLVCSHSHTHKNMAEITDEERHVEFGESSKILREKGFHFGSRCFVAPYGGWSTAADYIARQYYSICRTNYISGRDNPVVDFPQAFPREHKYLSPHNTDTPEQIKAWIDKTIDEKGAFNIAWHFVETIDNPTTYYYDEESFEEVCAYLKQKVDEGVVIAPTWQDAMLQTLNPQPFDLDGKRYQTSYKGQPAIVTLPV